MNSYDWKHLIFQRSKYSSVSSFATSGLLKTKVCLSVKTETMINKTWKKLKRNIGKYKYASDIQEWLYYVIKHIFISTFVSSLLKLQDDVA